MLVSVCMPLHRAVELDYPFREAIRSAYEVADEILLLCPETDPDGTAEACEELAREESRVRVFRQDWWNKDNRGKYSIADATNYLVEQSCSRYFLCLQADEVIHENQAAIIRSIARNGRYHMVRFARLNFFGSFDVVDSKPDRWGSAALRMGHRRFFPQVRSGDDGHGLTHDIAVNTLEAGYLVQFWHYAYVRDPAALLARHDGMARLYGFGSDPRWAQAREEGRFDWWRIEGHEDFVPIPGPHPRVMHEWIEQRRPLVESGVIR